VAYTSDDLVSAVRLRSRLPTATDISASEILGIADDEIATTISDLIRNVDPSFWMATHTATLVSGTAEYFLPLRALGSGIERVELEDSSGNRQPVVALNEHDSWMWANGGRDAAWIGRFGYILDGDNVRLLPTPESADAGLTLRVRYQRAPSRLAPVSDCASFWVVDSTTQLTCTAAPSAISTDEFYDLISGRGTHEVVFADRLVATVNVGTFVVTFDADTPISATAFPYYPSAPAGYPNGFYNYLAPAGTTPLPQIPASVWPVLVRATVRTLLDEIGDERGAARAQAILEQHIAAAKSVTTPRTRQVPTFVNHNSYLRRGRGWGG